jgi:hypothetical protein
MNQQIDVIARDVYGQTLTYPVCDKAKLLAQLTAKKTFTANTLRLIKALGYTVNYLTLTP